MDYWSAQNDLKAETIHTINYEKHIKVGNESLRDTYKHKKKAARNRSCFLTALSSTLLIYFL